jgi:aminopeptidase-like protein
MLVSSSSLFDTKTAWRLVQQCESLIMTDVAAELYSHVRYLFPILRSITGPGLRETLSYIASMTGASVHEVPTGTRILDWEVPKEWTIRGASIRRLSGETVVDFADNNLHVVQYSQGINAEIPFSELDAHLYSLVNYPGLVPYRTGYYAESWGFCVSQEQRETLTDSRYKVEIDAELSAGSLSYGELLLPGATAQEVLFSVHCCHPSLANDNLSAISVAIALARQMASLRTRRYSYRFLFLPGTIGAIAWLHANRDASKRVQSGLVLSCLGDSALPTYKQSRRGNAPIDRYVAHAFKTRGIVGRILPFTPYGYDERQYCSPGFNLPVGCLMRSPNGTFPEYHTSADNLDFIQPEALADSLAVINEIVALIEQDYVPVNLMPFGEPQLGRRGLYASIGGGKASEGAEFGQLTLLWVLNQADGTNSLLDIADRSGEPFARVAAAAAALEKVGLLQRRTLTYSAVE